MILTDQNGTQHELCDLVNLDYTLSRWFRNYYFSPRNAKIWKSKVTHFNKHTGIFRERIKDASGNGFTYKIGRIQPNGEVETVVFNLTPAESLKEYHKINQISQTAQSLKPLG